MGCNSAKPAVPPPTLDEIDPDLPKTKRSQALFSRGESQAEEATAAIAELIDQNKATPLPPNDKKSIIEEISIDNHQQQIIVEKVDEIKPTVIPLTTAVVEEKKEILEEEKQVEIIVIEEDQDEDSVPVEHLTAQKEEEEQQQLEKEISPRIEQEDEMEVSISLKESEEEEEKPKKITEEEKPINENDLLTVEDRLATQNKVEYPSAAAALNAKGLQRYSKELEKRGIIEYRDLATLQEDVNDPFWNRMPPFPDRKKMRALIAEAKDFLKPENVMETIVEKPKNENVNVSSTPTVVATAPEVIDLAAAAAAVAQENNIANEVIVEGSQDIKTEEEQEEDTTSDVIAPLPPARQKTEKPCDDFETDVCAEFGMCTCGHPKKDHIQLDKAPSFVRTPSKKITEEETVTPTDGSVCNNYRVDLTAKDFGQCKCGHPKSLHVNQNSSNGGSGTNKFKELPKGSFSKAKSPEAKPKSIDSAEKTLASESQDAENLL